jgi:NAD(P)-dependent dehydrogenase (short-subunit alcohol dehydrogenase family)
MKTKNRQSATTEKPDWFITGCSTGFGRELAKLVLECGYRVVVTARHPAEVNDLAGLGESLVLKLDVTKQGQISAAIKTAKKKFGRTDVLVNNAGIGYFAAVEESEEKEVRRTQRHLRVKANHCLGRRSFRLSEEGIQLSVTCSSESNRVRRGRISDQTNLRPRSMPGNSGSSRGKNSFQPGHRKAS